MASLAVMWYHFTQSTRDFLPNGSWLKATGTYGWVGVEVFFVVSGFVIPYAMYKSAYTLRYYGRFVLKRMIRLDPPYFASAILAATAFYAISRVRGIPDPRLDPAALLLHIGYLNVYFPKKPWLNVAYWTLAVEVQYYLTVGLIFPLLCDRRRIVRLGLFAALIFVCYWIPPGEYASTFVLVFMVGFAIFQLRVGIISELECLLIVAALGFGIAFTLGSPQAISATLAGAFIASRNNWKIPHTLLWLGDISYSIYLMHAVTGLLLIPVARDLGYTATLAGKLATLLLAIATCLISSWMLYRFVERPSRELAARFGKAK